MQLPGELMLQVDPGRPELVDEVLDWAGETASGRLSVELAGTETWVAAALERRGCARVPDGAFMLAMSRSLRRLPDLPGLPDGFVIREQEGAGDFAGRAAAHRAAFGSEWVTVERHVRMRGTWPYRPEFDLVVVAPDGGVAAYCQGWFDEVNGVGEFEPVGTRPEFRRLGLARTVCTAVLHAFAKAGGRRAVVYCRGDDAYPVPRRLYESMGFAAYTRTHWYR
ncbi:GNAT family N-acetyltransferase [Spirillospora sp. NPDC047279]|uniref:GNAT family N-acetyltransferase n=1 Tax=Spirillospora sp. NPDC047279 TaxID=3155478 RepID=UPI0033C61135